MPIELDPSRSAFRPYFAESSSAQPPVKTSATSSDSMRSLANSDGGAMIGLGFFGWIGAMIRAFFQSILSCLGLSSKVEPIENGPALKQRIEKGTQLITEYFNSDIFNGLDPARSAVMVTIQFNREVSILFSRLSEGKEDIKQAALLKLRDLLGNDNNKACEDELLSIRTMTFLKNGPDNFQCKSLLSWIDFEEGKQSEIMKSCVPEVRSDGVLSVTKAVIRDSRNSGTVYPQQQIENFIGS